MSLSEFKPVPVPKLGGLYTFLKPVDIPAGYSPNLQNVRFLPRAVLTRPGLTSRMAANVSVYGLSQFFGNAVAGHARNPVKTLLALDSNGSLDYQDPVSGVSTSLMANVCNPGAFMTSKTAFGRQFLAFFDSDLSPASPIRQWDGMTNTLPLAHVTPDGPGANGTAADTVNAGHIPAGVHTFWVSYETLFGYITAPSVAGTWTAGGNKTVLLSAIPTGPWYVTARRVFFSIAGALHMYYQTGGGPNNYKSGRIADNTTTSVEFDFDDTFLTQSTQVDYLTRNFAIPPAMGFADYGGRMTVWGCLNSVKFNNLNFDGGWNGNTPLGWVQVAAGQTKETTGSFAGESLKITGDGATAIRGRVSNNGAATAAFVLNTAYTLSIRLKATAGIVNGRLNVILRSATSGITYGTYQIAGSKISSFWQEYSTAWIAGIAVSLPADTIFEVFVDQTLDNTKSIWVDHPQIVPTNNAYESSVLRVSNPFDPETFDSISGFLYAAKDNGEVITACTEMRSFFYVLKEGSLHTTYDDGSTLPSGWFVREVDDTAGCPNPRALVCTKSMLLYPARSGVHRYDGSRPVKLSQEIQKDWKALNWTASGTIHSLLDPEQKVAYFFTPTGTDLFPKASYILDYSEGMGQEDDPGPRKWGRDKWTQAITASWRFENGVSAQTIWGGQPGTQSIFLGGNEVYEHTGTNDDGDAIDSFYDTAFLKAGDSGQDLFGGVSCYIEGSGAALGFLIGLDEVQVQALQNQNLVAAPGREYEMLANMEIERAKVRVESNVLDTYFTIKGISVYGKPWAEQRVM